MVETVIKLSNVSKYYKLYSDPKNRLKEALHPGKKEYHQKHYALKNIDLEIKEGDVLGVVGRNGCGKSTLLKLITGVLSSSGGDVSVRGKVTALLELGAGFNPEFTGIENIHFYASVLGFSNADIEAQLASIIEFAELGEYINQPVKTYSSGMKSRLGFAVAVHVDPEILILDEVLSVGDALFKRKCYAKMEEFFKAGKTIIYVSHSTDSINRLCNRAVLIHDGNIVMDDKPKLVTRYYEKLLFGKEENLEKIAEEVKSISSNMSNDVEFLDESSDFSDIKLTHDSGKNAYFVDGFISKTAIFHENYDVKISVPVIKCKDGAVVNTLVVGDTYTYHYSVVFGVDAQDVSFSLGVKTERGDKISGAALKNIDECIDEIKAGEAYDIQWCFTCNILAGIYYTDNGISGVIDGQRVPLNKSVDALVFRVQKPKQYIAARLVDLKQSVAVKKITPVL